MPPGRRMPFSSSLRHALTSFVLDLINATQQLPTLRHWRQATLALLLLSSNGTALHCSTIRNYSTTNYPKYLSTFESIQTTTRTTCDFSAALNCFQNEETSQHAGTSPSLLGSTSTVFSPPLQEVPQVKHAELNHETGHVNATKTHFLTCKMYQNENAFLMRFVHRNDWNQDNFANLFFCTSDFRTLHLGQCADLKKNVLDLICWGLLDSWQGTTPPSSLRTARSRVDRHASKFTWESVKPREESSSMCDWWIPKIAKAKNAHERKKDRDRQSTVHTSFTC